VEDWVLRMVVLPELSRPMMMIFNYFFPISFEKILPKNPPIYTFIIFIGRKGKGN
jgi:hypothetical protein